MPPHPKESVKLLRNELRQKRSDIPSPIRATHDQAIRQRLLQVINSQAVKTLACYWPFDGEPDLIPLCKQLMTGDYEVALPVISVSDDYTMEFYPYNSGTELRRNQYGIYQPQKTISMPLCGFDMLLMPLVAYDKTGNRMGMGSGYYDRHLGSLRDLHQPLRVGVAYSLQEVDQINKNDWDIPLHAVVNEHEWISFI
jgi:5-formyltetrahydrofolate cyclo-ligase